VTLVDMHMIDMTSACLRTAKLLDGVGDDQLDGRTPCEKLSLAEVVAHVGGLAAAFAAGARKDFGELTDTPPGDGGYRLDVDWRTRYPLALAALAEAWQDASAWEGMTRVGGVDMPGDIAGAVALGEVVIHGWDIARATGQNYEVDDDVADAVYAQVASFAADGPVEGLFGPAVAVPDDAPVFERALGLSGRSPDWRP
jgi:uncharacterized protein (TIGR03086 family)